MGKKIKAVIGFLAKRYWLFLLLVAVVSYGQLLFMFPWQDDHTLFFKLANIEGKAGYFGYGPLGQGVYKYIVTPYIPIYEIFGLQPPPFFALVILFYFLAAIAVYKVFSQVIGERGGRVAGFLYAAGYVASDGYIRVFNSVSTSIGIILVSLLFLSYWKFFKERKYFWYFLSVLFYFSALEFARLRTHYLIAVVFAFELFFFASRDFAKSLPKSLIRLIPFVYIFYRYFLKGGADPRSAQVGSFFQSLLKGEFYKLYSSLSASTNIISPDWLLGFLVQSVQSHYLYFGIFLTFVILLALLLKKSPKRRIAIGLFLLASLVWLLVSRSFFSNPALNPNSMDLLVVFLGGEIMMFVPVIFFRLTKKWRILFFFLFFWLILNIASYSIYNPALRFVQYHRYLAHSFFALVGILALFSTQSKLVRRLVLIWGIISLISAVSYQGSILNTRSFPTKRFYQELKAHVPTIEKGDIFYFDVADNARGYFADAFSVASMPEETTLAWQYGVDRYDIRRVIEFSNLVKMINEGSFTDINNESVPINNVYSFFYSREGLVNTTEEFQVRLESQEKSREIHMAVKKEKNEVLVTLSEPIVSLTPSLLTLNLKANPPSSEEFAFSLRPQDKSFIGSAFDYQRQKNLLAKNVKTSASSFWKEDIANHLTDGRDDTHWRADRVLWTKEGAFFTLDLGKNVSIDRLVWINGSAANTPTRYEIEVSLDNQKWQRVAQVAAPTRIEPDELQVASFSSTEARYVRMLVLETLSNDSASIAEAWVVPDKFKNLDIKQAEEFLARPLNFISNEQSLWFTLSQMGYQGKVQVSWMGDKSESWRTRTTAFIPLQYDGALRTYSFFLPAGGTKIEKLKLSQDQIPGTLEVEGIFVENLIIESL